VPFNVSASAGLAIAHHGGWCWLSAPFGVWRASLQETAVDLGPDILSLAHDAGTGPGGLTVELRNDGARYASLPAPLETGCTLEFSPGYVTQQGPETAGSLSFALEAMEYISAGGKSSLVLHAVDGWTRLRNWSSRSEYRWNASAAEASVRQILAFVLARAGLRLETVSESAAIGNGCPDFSIHAGDPGDAVVRDLLSLVSDVLFIEGNTGWLVDPRTSDAAVYAYGAGHFLFEGKFKQQAWGVNRAQVEGFDPGTETMVLADAFVWGEIERLHDRLVRVRDTNTGSVADAETRGEALLRHAEIEAGGGWILVPVNCGQQMYDVIEVTDEGAGLSSAKRRVIALGLTFNPSRGKYEQRITLGNP
jgi:hypothetical protein